uniref:Intraflagellar transport protein 46 homolog n=1 Tax=Daphnia hispanica TaxID=575233 RepID=A0A4Y7M8L9_9CRUS|nr:EOG090X0FP3 [Daphnia hispanica]
MSPTSTELDFHSKNETDSMSQDLRADSDTPAEPFNEEIFHAKDESEMDNLQHEEENDGSIANLYDPIEFNSVNVPFQIRELFHFITKYRPQILEMETKLKPFLPDFIPAVGDPDAFLKIDRPDENNEFLGLTLIDEPSLSQSDPSVLDLRLRSIYKQSSAKKTVARTVEEGNKVKTIEKWIKDINELHRSKPLPTVNYNKPLPDIDTLLQEWNPDVEDVLCEDKILPSNLNCDLLSFIDLACDDENPTPLSTEKVSSARVDFVPDLAVPYEDCNAMQSNLQQLDGNQKNGPAFKMVPLSNVEWEAGILLLLRQKFHIPFEALIVISSAIHDSFIQQLFKRLEEDVLTRSKLETLWTKSFPTIMPKELKFNKNDPSYQWVINESFGPVLDEVFEVGYFVPFLKSLEQFLSIRQVHDSVLNSFSLGNRRDKTDIYSDVWDGTYTKQNPLFLEKKDKFSVFKFIWMMLNWLTHWGVKKGNIKFQFFTGCF